MTESLEAINVLRAGRNLPALDPALLKLDPYRSVDLRLTKAIPFGGGRRLELLLEAFNVTNHVNFPGAARKSAKCRREHQYPVVPGANRRA